MLTSSNLREEQGTHRSLRSGDFIPQLNKRDNLIKIHIDLESIYSGEMIGTVGKDQSHARKGNFVVLDRDGDERFCSFANSTEEHFKKETGY